MLLLTNDQVPISGFASIRERVLIQDRQYFPHLAADECWDAFGPLVYLANAWLLPHGSTGRHYHSNVDIVSILPHGAILHQGSIGDGITLHKNQAQIQRSGQEGFSHNEINPSAQIQPFVQLWLTPVTQEKATYDIVHLPENATTTIVRRKDFKLAVGRWQSVSHWHSTRPSLLYFINGIGKISTASQTAQIIKRGTLAFSPKGLTLNAAQDAIFICATLE